MALTGRRNGPPLVAPAGVVERMQHLGAPLSVDVLGLLGERAAEANLSRRGAISCGGAARLLRCLDGCIAVNLARPDDRSAVPAWLGTEAAGLGWRAIAAVVTDLTSEQLVGQAMQLGLPVAAVGEIGNDTISTGMPVVPRRVGDAEPIAHPPLVVDLSSLWAGPLCARLLAARGARVVKVESATRTDGTRLGPLGFFDAMQAHARSVCLDFGDRDGRTALAALVARADVVIEASRARALLQLGIDARSVLSSPGPRIWISITGYGRHSNRVAFGDDAAAAGGLVARYDEELLFVADAIADPLTGVAAAAAAAECLDRGGRWMLDISMARVAAHVIGADRDEPWLAAPELFADQPRLHDAHGKGPVLGAHNAAVAADLGLHLP